MGRHQALSIGGERGVTEFYLGSIQSDYPVGKTLEQANMFINRFIEVDGDYLVMSWFEVLSVMIECYHVYFLSSLFHSSYVIDFNANKQYRCSYLCYYVH